MSLASIFRKFFPVPEMKSAERFLLEHTQNPLFLQNTNQLEAATAGRRIPLQERLYAHARSYLAEEQDRANSAISRAQGLLVAQTFFGILLAFAGAAMGHTEIYKGWHSCPIVALVLYILIQIVLLTYSALRAAGSLEYSRIGSSDLIAWFAQSETQLVRRIGLMTLDNYRKAAISNSWRIIHLRYAQECLRNTIFALALLIILVFVITIDPGFPSFWSTLTIPPMKDRFLCPDCVLQV